MAVEEKHTDASNSSEDLLAPCISGPAQLLRGSSRGLDLCAERRGLNTCILERVARMVSGLGLPCCGRGARRSRGPEDDDEDCPPLLELSADAGTFEGLYEVGEKLGEGSFGVVYACAPRSLAVVAAVVRGGCGDGGMHLAVKVVPTHGRHCSRQSKLGDEERAELVRLFMALDHPNIVRHRRFVETPDMLYIVMDRCEGPDLLGHVESCGEQQSFEHVRTLASHILGAIAAVHALGMMHRDVKPENFRFKDKAATCLQLLDFGAAKPAPKEPAAHSVTGTLLFAAPEVFGGEYNCLCDVWSAGIVLFLLISGHLPFETSDVTMLRSMHKDPVLTGDSLLRGPRWQRAPPAVRSFMRDLLAADPAARVPAAEALGHRWLTGDDASEEEEAEERTFGLGLRAASRSASMVDLKRSFFVWNLAECDDSDEFPSDAAPAQQIVDEALELMKAKASNGAAEDEGSGDDAEAEAEEGTRDGDAPPPAPRPLARCA